MEGWTLSCSCSLSGGSRGEVVGWGGAVTDQMQLYPGLSDCEKRSRRNRNDPFTWSFIQQVQSRACLGQQMAAVLFRRIYAMLGTRNPQITLWPCPQQEQD